MSIQLAGTRDGSPRLVRSLTLTHAVLYGLGVTIGAGIYVLVGIAAGKSGTRAPLAFVGAALVMTFSAASFAELGTPARPPRCKPLLGAIWLSPGVWASGGRGPSPNSVGFTSRKCQDGLLKERDLRRTT
jgi:hypothetical protein